MRVVLDASVTMSWYFADEINDTAYLDLAQRLDYPLVTLDKQLIRAANGAGIPLLLDSA